MTTIGVFLSVLFLKNPQRITTIISIHTAHSCVLFWGQFDKNLYIKLTSVAILLEFNTIARLVKTTRKVLLNWAALFEAGLR